jgi:hypothetical protein
VFHQPHSPEDFPVALVCSREWSLPEDAPGVEELAIIDPYGPSKTLAWPNGMFVRRSRPHLSTR